MIGMRAAAFVAAGAALGAALRARALSTAAPRARAVVFSYNILADGPRYAMKSKFDYCPLATREWTARWPRILSVLEAADADVICVQEAQRVTFERDLQPAMHRLGYDGFLAEREPTMDMSQTDALFVRRSAFRVLGDVRVVRFRDEALVALPESAVRDLLADLPDVAVVARLEHVASGRRLCVTGTHLHWMPAHPDLKALQAWLLARALQEERPLPIVLAGDFNSMNIKREADEWDPVVPPGGLVAGAYALLVGDGVDASHPDHPVPRRGAATGDVPEQLEAALPLRSAHHEFFGCEPPLTTMTSSFQGCLDYVFVSEDVDVLGVAPVPELRAPIPDAHTHPSDHLPMRVEVSF